jgi:hypothetical protein
MSIHIRTPAHTHIRVYIYAIYFNIMHSIYKLIIIVINNNHDNNYAIDANIDDYQALKYNLY